MTALRFCVSHIKIVKRHILNNLLLLVNISFRDWNIFLSLKIVFSGVRIRSTDSLDSTAGGFNINDISDSYFLLLDIFVDAGVKFELLLTLCRFETNYDSIDNFAVPSMRIFLLLGGNLGDFTFPDFFSLFDSQTDGSTEVFHQDLSLLDLGRVDLRTNHRAERHLRSKLG